RPRPRLRRNMVVICDQRERRRAQPQAQAGVKLCVGEPVGFSEAGEILWNACEPMARYPALRAEGDQLSAASAAGIRDRVEGLRQGVSIDGGVEEKFARFGDAR